MYIYTVYIYICIVSALLLNRNIHALFISILGYSSQVVHNIPTVLHCNSKELQAVNVSIAQAAVDGKMDGNPFIQGLLMQCLRKLDKDQRGVQTCGRKASCTETERELVESAAFQFALGGGSKELAAEIGQNLRPRPLAVDSLPSLGLPNPALALRSSCTAQLKTNSELADQLYARNPDMPTRRLCMAVDHTYLDKALSQTIIQGDRGLVGLAWHPQQEGKEFMSLSELPADAFSTPKAPLMLEALVWDPAGVKQQCVSLASMPMSLSAHASEDVDKNHGKRVTRWVSEYVLVIVFLRVSYIFRLLNVLKHSY